MAKSRFKRLKRFGRDTEGATAIEFAIVITPLLMLLLGTFQMAIVFFYDQALQSATQAASRLVMTGSVQGAANPQQAFDNAVCADAGVLFNCTNLMIDVQSAANFQALNPTPITLTYSNGKVSNNFNFNPGGPSQVVIIRVMYNFPVWFPVLLPAFVNQPGNNILLTATSVLQSEPYQ